MNKEALDRIRPHLSFLGVRVLKIAFNVSLEEKAQLARMGQTLAFSRLNWQCNNQSFFEPEPLEGQAQQQFVSFMIETKYDMAIMPDDGKPIPESQPIPKESEVATTEITFLVDYVCDIKPDQLSLDDLREFVQFNSPLHFWPYWRENLQNVATRAQMVLPFLPPYIVPKSDPPPAGTTTQ